ncbi:MAG: zinc ribbon domain-containing protein [Bacillota bacterium]
MTGLIIWLAFTAIGIFILFLIIRNAIDDSQMAQDIRSIRVMLSKRLGEDFKEYECGNEEAVKSKNKCPNCNAVLTLGIKECPGCGLPLDD